MPEKRGWTERRNIQHSAKEIAEDKGEINMGKSPLSVLKDFAEKPFTLWDLKGKQFTIIEDIRPQKDVREKMETSQKNGKPYTTYRIKIEEGVFQKDLSMYDSELEKLFLAMPTTLSTYIGATIKVENNFSKDLKYMGTVQQDMQGNPLGNLGSTNTNQVDRLYGQLAQAITLCQRIGQKTTKEVTEQVARNIIPPGQNVEAFVQAAKMAGWLVERDGIFSGTA